MTLCTVVKRFKIEVDNVGVPCESRTPPPEARNRRRASDGGMTRLRVSQSLYVETRELALAQFQPMIMLNGILVGYLLQRRKVAQSSPSQGGPNPLSAFT